MNEIKKMFEDEYGYKKVKFIKEWNKFKVYLGYNNLFAHEGYPKYVLKNEKELRFASNSETLDILASW